MNSLPTALSPHRLVFLDTNVFPITSAPIPVTPPFAPLS